ncbi:pentatricopeptide repeat-containing protein At4g02750 [Selaginella moellendorffii]|nr:pentatricopeptide repeat-containing protein At4g02750 [Selaginella moellendorffii]|eukprot:XP_002987885.2 pentatricopeptide repeat-containing protein At4g02750 [Selaginella moellendorffii]
MLRRWLHCETAQRRVGSASLSLSDHKTTKLKEDSPAPAAKKKSKKKKKAKKAAEPTPELDEAKVPPSAKADHPASYVDLLRKCSSRAHLPDLRQLHSQLVGNGYARRPGIATKLIQMYGRCGSLSDARLVFDSIASKDRSIDLCNAMITTCSQNGDAAGAHTVFQSMPKSRKMRTDDLTASNSMIAAYGKAKSVADAKRLFDRMERRDEVTWTAVVAVYAQNGHSRDAKLLFDAMPRRGIIVATAMLGVCARGGQAHQVWDLFTEMEGRDVFSWGVLISVLSRHGRMQDARFVFDKMPLRSTVSWTTTITAYAKCGDLDEARRLFDAMPQPDVITWTSLMTAYAQGGLSREAVELFKLMDLEGVEADKYSFSIVLDACARLSDVAEGRRVHRTIAELGPMDVVVTNSLLNMYGKCGNMAEAVAAFEGVAAMQRVVATWNALIAAYTENGWHESAFGAFRALNLDGVVQPNAITFIGIFTACSHTGKLEDARDYFLCMAPDFGVTPVADHYVCMSDLLGRVGKLVESEELIGSMPFHPDPVAWLGLMGSCRTHLNADVAERAAEHVYVSDPGCPSPYILLSNIYAALGRTKDLLRIRRLMKMRGVKNNQALAYVQVKDRLVPFAVARWTKKFYKDHCSRSE